MNEETCVFHPGQKAVSYCVKCGKSYCAVCLVSEEGQTLCRSCVDVPKPPPSLEDLDHLLKKSPQADDDPLGLFGSKTQVGTPVPSVSAPGPLPLMKPDPPPAPSVPAPMPAPGVAVAPSIPAVSSTAPPLPETKISPSETVPLRAMPGFGYDQPRRDASPLVTLWWKVEKVLGKVSKTTRIPGPALIGIAILLVLGLLTVPVLLLLRKPSVRTLDLLPPVHVVKVQVSQVGELDIATYLEMEGKLLASGFSPLLQMTLPQAPSPNFIAVFIKESAGVYAEILKVPGSMAPRVSYITVFNNGIWCSTNGFPGKDLQEEYLLSTHHPNDASDALYVKHVQKVEQLRKQNGWASARMGESRYVAAFTDHFRWFLSLKKIPGYKASFELWH